MSLPSIRLRPLKKLDGGQGNAGKVTEGYAEGQKNGADNLEEEEWNDEDVSNQQLPSTLFFGIRGQQVGTTIIFNLSDSPAHVLRRATLLCLKTQLYVSVSACATLMS